MNAEKKFSTPRFILLIGVPILIGIATFIVYLKNGRYVETDNAYVQSDIVPISSEVSGIIHRVLVKENQRVAKGDILFELDAEPLLLEIDKAKANLQQISSDLNALRMSYLEKEASIDLAKSNAAFSQRELDRQLDLKGKNFISESTLDDLQHAADISKQQLTVLKLDLKKIRENLGGDENAPIKEHPRYLGAMASLRTAELNLQKTKIRAPSSGYVSQLPKNGAYARAGNLLSSLVLDDPVWVEANFPETDLTHVREGQTVKIHIDTYPDEVWQGVVESISPATGAEFAILPPQNATGNWVKIAQRIPVRIAFDDGDKESAPPLRVGMSALIEIDTKHEKKLMALLSR